MSNLSDPPATRADLDPGMLQLPGDGKPGYAPFPVTPSFSTVYNLNWNAHWNPDQIAASYIIGDAEGGKRVDITRKEFAMQARRAGKYVLEQMGLHERDTLSIDRKVWRKGFKDQMMPPIVAVIAHAEPLSYRVVGELCGSA